jgi:autotransporter-associated beta strand protein
VSGSATATINFASPGTLTVNQAGDTTYAGVISGTGGGLTKTGPGRLTLFGLNSFTGPLTIAGGTLDVTAINSSSGMAQPLGASPNTITIGSASANGAFEYSGAADVTLRRTFTIGGAGGGTVRSIGGTLSILNGSSGGNNIIGGGNPVTLDGSGNIIVTGIITGTGTSLTKTGTGTATLQAVNTYTGATTIAGGTLALSDTGFISASSIITVGPTGPGPIFDLTAETNHLRLQSGQTLRGLGLIVSGLPGVQVRTGATIAPGMGLGTLTNDGNFIVDGTFAAAVSSGGSSNRLALVGAFTNLLLNSTSTLTVSDLGGGFDGSTYTIATFGSLTGTFGSVSPNVAAHGYTADYAGSPGSIILRPTAVPEPGTLALAALASVGGLAGWRRRGWPAALSP